MPFRSARQRAYLRRHRPEVYRRWVKKYGRKVRPLKRKRRRKKGRKARRRR